MSKKQYTARTPLGVKGGIRAQGAALGPNRAWWSRRWTEVFEGFRLGARLGRGRSYAVSGQVSELEIVPGRVTALVQGAAPEPYRSEISFKTVSGAARESLVEALRQRPMLTARLLVSDLPQETEELFRAAGCPLFPRRKEDLVSRCSCPDYANPCKHLAAVYCLLGDEITRSPLLLLALRGITRADLVGEPPEPPRPCDMSASATDPVPFYGAPPEAEPDYGPATHSTARAPLICRLGPLPFWRGHERFIDTMEHLYARAAARGWTVWTGEPLDLRREDEKVIVKGASLHLKRRSIRADSSWM
ncbi:MAG: SWIM zinc finger family protein [Kiritimatiellae bacterium]|nr:SWIM zinc finger family protein [Kiritimatiellia bacterium]